MIELWMEDIEIECRIGVTKEERSHPQVVTVSIIVQLDDAAGRPEDSLDSTVDYARLIEDARRLTEGRTFNLLETLADAVASLALSRERVAGATIKASKKPFAGVRSVSAVVRRQK